MWSRLKKARLVQILLIYLGAAWVILEVSLALRDALELPDWIAPVALILLAAGFVALWPKRQRG